MEVIKLKVPDVVTAIGFFEKFDKGLAGDDQATMLWAAEYEALELLEKERAVIQRMLSQCK